MTETVKQILFALLRSAISGDGLTDEGRALCDDKEAVNAALKLAKRHDLAHLLELALWKNGLGESGGAETTMAGYRYTKLKYELSHITKTFEEAKIPFMPLKGSVLREYYPEPWMRTSCDIDVLVHEEDLERAVAELEQRLSYKSHGKNSHDVALDTPSKMHIELHYNLIEDAYAQASSCVLFSVWDTAILSEGYSYKYEMPSEMFSFYHIAHMAKHFENGGCGIRPVLDLFVLKKSGSADPCQENDLLLRGGLLKFAEVVHALSRVWFYGEEHSKITKEMENYILAGGVYGTTENSVLLQQQKRGGKFKYLMSKIFIPYEVIKFHYPVLQKHLWLTPIMEVRRWFRIAFCGHAKRVTREMKYNNSISKDKAAQMQSFLEEIGLK